MHEIPDLPVICAAGFHAKTFVALYRFGNYGLRKPRISWKPESALE